MCSRVPVGFCPVGLLRCAMWWPTKVDEAKRWSLGYVIVKRLERRPH